MKLQLAAAAILTASFINGAVGKLWDQDGGDLESALAGSNYEKPGNAAILVQQKPIKLRVKPPFENIQSVSEALLPDEARDETEGAVIEPRIARRGLERRQFSRSRGIVSRIRSKMSRSMRRIKNKLGLRKFKNKLRRKKNRLKNKLRKKKNSRKNRLRRKKKQRAARKRLRKMRRKMKKQMRKMKKKMRDLKRRLKKARGRKARRRIRKMMKEAERTMRAMKRNMRKGAGGMFRQGRRGRGWKRLAKRDLPQNSNSFHGSREGATQNQLVSRDLGTPVDMVD